MKKIASVLIASIIIIIACNKVNNTQYSDNVIWVKGALDSLAIAENNKEITMSINDIYRIMEGENNEISAACVNYQMKRRIGQNIDYRIDDFFIEKILLKSFGKTKGELDINNDDIFDTIDFRYLINQYGYSFEKIQYDSITLTGGGISGAGLFAMYENDSLPINGENIEIISLFEGSNCFVRYEGEDQYCRNSTTSFATENGVVYYSIINK